MATLSVCLIVKNEEHFIADCLESVRPVADQIIVVDTGCTDGTIKIAKKYDAEIYPFKWINDFAAARNESIKHATGDWILWLDADERLEADSRKELKRLLTRESHPLAYVVQIKNLMRDGSNYKMSGAHRLFTNHKGIQFQGRIHEQIAYSVAALGGREKTSRIQLLHLGYGLDVKKQKEKDRRNRLLLEKLVADEPDNAFAHYTLGQNYLMAGEPDRAQKEFESALAANNFDTGMQASLLNVLAEALANLKQYDEADARAAQSIRLQPDQVGAYFMRYRIANERGLDDQAVEWLQRTCEQNDKMSRSVKKLATDVIIDRDQLLQTLARLYEKNGRLQEALKTYLATSDAFKEKRGNLQHIVQICLNSGDWNNAELLLSKYVTDPQPADLDLLGTVLIKGRKFREAIRVYEQLLQQLPQANIIRRLAGLYAKVGDIHAAQRLLSRVA